MSVAAHVIVPTAVTTIVIRITVAVVIRIMTAAGRPVLAYDTKFVTNVVRVVMATHDEVAPPEVDVS